MAWSFVCPASRGIGFALTRQLLQTTNIPVVATARNNVAAIKRSILSDLPDIDPKRLTVIELDVTDEASISAAAAHAKSLFPAPNFHLRLAFAVPGILHAEKSPSQIDAEAALSTFRINTIGPLLLIKHFSPFLPKKKTPLRVVAENDAREEEEDGHYQTEEEDKGLPPHAVWATMSARVGSTTDNSLGGWYSYRASKAAVNSLTKTFDLFLKTSAGEKAMAVALHPGTVKTGLSKEYWATVKKEKLFTPEFSAGKLVEVVNGLELESGRGRCWDWKGEEILP